MEFAASKTNAISDFQFFVKCGFYYFFSALLNFFCVCGIVFTDEGLFCEEANLAAKRALLFKKVSLQRSWLYGKV